jgi:aminoglycoside phosphotransferase family enzyme
MPADLSAFISDIHQESTALFDRASCIFACLDSNDTEKLSDAFSDFFRVLTSSIFAKRTQRGLVKACEAFQEEIVKFINNEYLIKMRNEIEKIEV